MEKALTISFKMKDGKFCPDEGTVVGKVKPDGRIEGTNYRFDPGEINGGIAISANKTLQKLDDETLFNPATGAEFKKSRSGKGYYDRKSNSFVKVWDIQDDK